MGLGVLDDNKLEHVPGTVFLNEAGVTNVAQNVEAITLASGLKHRNNIVLVPQPTASPHDPLNWPRWKKELFMVAFTIGMGAVGAVGALLSAAAVPIAKKWGVSVTEFTHNYNVVLLACLAVSSVVMNAIAIKYGKRPVLLANTVLLAVGHFWAGAAKTLGSLAGARAIMGIGLGPWESLIPASIADVWFVHERGFRIGVFTVGLVGGLNLVLPISAVIITDYGWRVVNYGMAGMFLLVIILVFLFMPESTYLRAEALNLDTSSHDNLPQLTKESAEHLEEPVASEKPTFTSTNNRTTTTDVSGRDSFWRQYHLWSGRTYNEASVFTLSVRPFQMALSPSVLWGGVIYSCGIAWLVLISVTVSQIFSARPYSFTVIHVGLTKLSSFTASILGALVSHPLSDRLAVYMAKRNKGIYEPEFRLPLVASFIVFTAVGFLSWGRAAELHDPWPVPVILGLGFITFGIQLTCTGATAYVIDCHREHSSETFAFLSFLKSVFSVILTLFVNDWIIHSGVDHVFYTLGGVTAGLTLTTIPM